MIRTRIPKLPRLTRAPLASLALAVLLTAGAGTPGLANPGAGSLFESLRYQEYPELEGKLVADVLVFGNNRTQDVVLRREMRTMRGRPFHAKDLWHDWERLVDLGLFAHVEVEAVAKESGGGVLVVVSVIERPSWFAAPIVDYDFDDEKLSFGYRVRVRNVDGMNRQLRSKGRIGGGRSQFTLSWYTPWIGQRPLPLSLELRVEPPRRGGDEFRTNMIAAATTKYLGDYKMIRQGFTVRTRLEELRRDETSPEGGVDQISPAAGLFFFRDTRNVRIDPDRGSLLSTGAEYVRGLTSGDLDYVRGLVDARLFLGLSPRAVLATRLETALTTGEVPSYRQLQLGGSGSLRGQPDGVLEGSNIARASLELRFPLLPQRRFRIPVPFVPEDIANFDLRFDGEVFVDAGLAWNNGADLPERPVKIGTGVGLRVFLPILELLRLEVAFDEDGEASFYFREGNMI